MKSPRFQALVSTGSLHPYNVVCDKVPKHKQRQGFATLAQPSSFTSPVDPVSFMSSAAAAAVAGASSQTSACCTGAGHHHVVHGLVLAGNFRTHAALPSLLPRIARL